MQPPAVRFERVSLAFDDHVDGERIDTMTEAQMMRVRDGICLVGCRRLVA